MRNLKIFIGTLVILFGIAPCLAQQKPDPKPEPITLTDKDSTAWLEAIIEQNQDQSNVTSIQNEIAALQGQLDAANKRLAESKLASQKAESDALKDAGKDPAKFTLIYTAQGRQFGVVARPEKKQ